MITASGLDRVAACPLSATLAHTQTASSTHAEDGTRLHAWVGACLRRDAPVSELPDHLRARGEALREVMRRPGVSALEDEIAMGIHPESGRAVILGHDGERKYPDEPGWIWGTADWAGYSEEYAWTWDVVEIKTGARPVPPAHRNAQLRFYVAAGILASDDVDAGRGTIAHARARSDDSVDMITSDVRMTELDALAYVAELRTIMRRVAEVKDPIPGPHCHWCPATRSCPAVGKWLAGLAADALPGKQRGNAGELWGLLSAAKSWTAEIQRALFAMADQEPIDLADGARLVVDDHDTERMRSGAYAVLEATAGAKIADAVTPTAERVVSKSRVRDAARIMVAEQGGSIVDHERGILSQMRATGVLSTTTTRKLTVIGGKSK